MIHGDAPFFSDVPILFLDVDGTLRTGVGGGFVNGPEDVALLPGAAEALYRNLCESEPRLVCWVSNQGGVAFGHTTSEKVELAFLRTHVLLVGALLGGEPEWAEPMPADLPEEASACGVQARRLLGLAADTILWCEGEYGVDRPTYRKPGPGMISLGAQIIRGREDLLPGDLMVGDRPEDAEAAEAAGIQFIHADVWRQSALASR